MRLYTLSLALAALPCFSQLRPDMGVTAVIHAKVVTGTGQTLEDATILMRHGLIEAVGTKISLPAGTQTLDAKGMTVYPGFIEADASKGLKKPAQADWAEQPDITLHAPTQMRSNHPFVHPQWTALENVDTKDGYWDTLRKGGFTTALAVPQQGIWKGQALLFNLGRTPLRENVLLPNAAQVLGLQGTSSQNYPGTPLGAFATARQALIDAQWQASASGNGQRAPFDLAAIPLANLLESNGRAILEADKRWQLDRFIDFCGEFKLKPIVCGAKESFRMIPRIKEAGLPLVVALDYANEPQPAPAKSDKPAMPKNSNDPASDASPAASKDNPDVPPAKLAEMQRLYMQSFTLPVQLAKAGVPFAITAKGASDMGTFFSKLQRLNKEGLSEQIILQALTSQPASILGIADKLGTIEVGKYANLTILSGSLLDEKSKAKFLYIDGHEIDLSRTPLVYTETPQNFDGEEN